MLESFLVAGRQDLVPGQPLVYGQSITDACIDLEETRQIFDILAEATQRRMAAATASL
jgi:3-deoxy-7-phosphoheptulonate synthase